MAYSRSPGRMLLQTMLFCVILAHLAFVRTVADDKTDSLRTDELLQGIRPLISGLVGREQKFQLTGNVKVPVDGKMHSVDVRVVRYDDESFDLMLTHEDFAIDLRRRAHVTALGLPKHKVAYVGRGNVDPADRLSPRLIADRLTSRGSKISELTPYVNALALGDLDALVRGILPTANVVFEIASGQWSVDGKATIKVPGPGSVEVQAGEIAATLTTVTDAGQAGSAEEWPDMKVVELDRNELERTLLRGVRRASEILAPSNLLTKPQQKTRTVPNGQLIWKDGQRVALLKGTPEDIGTAHGQLLPAESTRCIESVLYAFGTANVINTGRWFRHDLVAAYARLAPFIPERHKTETRALAAALNLEPEVVEVLNVFPELFHCSGFAVFGSATKDGKLYHGRVLDYMTTIGLQDAATTFIVQAEGQIPFANVGYAGFIGSVSGMNMEAISLGEMGGRGEGAWDGVPMATLMRRAMEECRTLDEVKALWSNSPRTCEYYYVFADGKTNQAVGVAATPEKIEFIEPGQGHELLGDGIKDTVVLSAGSRLTELRSRVNDKHGKIDAELGQWLMSRPVAMQSNLHNVLFVPQDRVLYVANASHTKPAADTSYVKLNMTELLQQVSSLPAQEVAGQ